MRGPVKGGLFVGAAVLVGLVAGLLVPSLVVAEREIAKRPKGGTPALPTMPSVVGRPLDEAEDELRRRSIPFTTDAPALIEDFVPTVLEVCETDPAPGQKVRTRVRVRAALAGTCEI
jgi:hypothetical protein